jgi:hypothetical protein
VHRDEERGGGTELEHQVEVHAGGVAEDHEGVERRLAVVVDEAPVAVEARARRGVAVGHESVAEGLDGAVCERGERDERSARELRETVGPTRR